MLHRVKLRPRPHVLLQYLLVRALLLPARPAQRVLDHLGPSFCPQFSCLSREICSPTTSNDGHPIGMQRVISHAVESFSALLPLHHRSHLPRCHPAIKISRRHLHNLRVQGGKEAPVHGEHGAGICEKRTRKFFHRTQI